MKCCGECFTQTFAGSQNISLKHQTPTKHPNIPNICRQPKQESVRFAGAPVLSSSKGEYWKVHNDDEEDEDYEEVDDEDDGFVENDEEEEDHEKVGHLIRDGRVDVLLAEVCSITVV